MRRMLQGRAKSRMPHKLNRVLILFACFSLYGCGQTLHSVGLASCAPVYGNWCGENYPLTGYEPDTVDSWDEACMVHDKCYESGKSKSACDRQFVQKLERLSRRRLAPQEMANAHSWFRRDGWVGGFISLKSEAWAAGADCKGGDGRRARFYCQTPFGSCPISAGVGPGQPGYPCNCGGAPGRLAQD